MYISKWFEENYSCSKAYYESSATLIETEKNDSLNLSLTTMRKKMIQRKEVSALICMGGKIKKNKEDEGIREEISLAIGNKIPVFVIGSVGGCSSVIASEYKSNDWQDLNDAPLEMNKEFAESLDYVMLSGKLLDYLQGKQ